MKQVRFIDFSLIFGLILLSVICNNAVLLAQEKKEPHFSCFAEHWGKLKGVLKKGDAIFAFCPRDPDLSSKRIGSKMNMGPKWNENKFVKRIEALKEVNAKGLEKAVVFSSSEDLRNNADRIPEDVSWVSYNTETGMTPKEELEDIENSLMHFAQFAHQKGWKVGWAPTLTMLMRSNDELLKLAVYVDSIGLQHQRLLQAKGLDEFVKETKRRAKIIRSINPNCQVGVQVVLERTGIELSIRALRLVVDTVDGFSVWSMKDTEGIKAVIKSLRDEKDGEV